MAYYKNNRSYKSRRSAARGRRPRYSRRFFGEKTYRFQRNPQINARDKRQSRYSVPFWISRRSLWKPRGVWHIDNRDRKAIYKLNRTYERRRRKNK